MKLFIPSAGTVAAAVFTACMAASAWADTPPPPPPPAAPPSPTLAEACRRDVQTLCAGIAPGEGRIGACLKANHQALSPGCKQAIRERRREKMQTPPPGAPPAGAPPSSPPPTPPSS